MNIMNVKNYKNEKVLDNPHKVDARKLFDSQNAQVIHLELKPGEKLIRHITPVDVIFYVLEGKGIVEIGNEKKEVAKDDLIESPANIPHCWYNESQSVLRFLVIKTPKPNKPTKLL